MAGNLTRKTVSSTNWGISRTIGQNAAAFITGIVLARLLAPEDFGLFAIGMIFVGLGNILSAFATVPAVIQKKNLRTENLQAALVLSLGAGLIVYSVLWFTAPFISDFFNEPEATSVIRYISIIFLLNGFSGICRGLLMRHFNYKPIFYIETSSHVLGYGATGIALAFIGFGVWSLVWGVLVQNALMTIFYLSYVRIPLKPAFSDGEYLWFFKFISGVSLLSFFNYLSTVIDNFIIARYLNATQLGFYSKAYGLMQMPVSNISYTLGGVSMSTFSRIQDEKDSLRKAYYKAIGLIFLISGPATAIMFLSSDYLIKGLYGPQWEGAVNAFRILSIGIAFKVLLGISGGLAKSTGNIFNETIRQFGFAVTLGVLSLVLLRYGIEGVAYAVTVASILFFLSLTQMSLQICGGKWIDFIRQFKGGLVLTAIIGAINYMVIFLIEQFIQGWALPLKLVLTLSILLITGTVLFFKLPEQWIGSNRDWLINTYAAKLPSRYGTYLKRFYS